MRAITVLLLCTCLAGSAVAEPSAFQRAMATPDSGANKSANAGTAMPSMIGGKFVVGYEGRGNYLKNEELAKQMTGGTVAKAPVSNPLAEDIALEEKQKAAGTTADARTDADAVQEPAKTTKLRSDATLRSDSSKAQAVTEAAATPPTPPAPPASPAPVPGAPNYNPMMLISNGRVVQQ